MPDASSAPIPPPTAGPTVACAGCKEQTADPIEVRTVDPGSGPLWPVYACPGCTPRYLGPAEIWRIAVAHLAHCPTCRSDGPCARGRMLLDVRRASRDRRRTR